MNIQFKARLGIKYTICTKMENCARFCNAIVCSNLLVKGLLVAPLDTMGVELDTHPAGHTLKGEHVNCSWTENLEENRVVQNKRSTERRSVTVPARLTWKDARGATRFASVTARNVSEFGVYVECQSPISIPLYRLVQLQLERASLEAAGLPSSLRQGRVLSAVYRVSPPSSSRPQGLALRMMVDPRRAASLEQTRATA
jgi:hypothetical protein